MSLEDILKNKNLFGLFEKYLEKTKSSENLRFINDVLEYKNMDGKRKINKYFYIINTYITLDSSQQININDNIRNDIVNNYIRDDIFDTAYKDICYLLKPQQLDFFEKADTKKILNKKESNISKLFDVFSSTINN